MRIEEVLEKGVDMEVSSINMHNREVANGATEAVTIVALRLPRRNDLEGMGMGYIDFSFEISRNQIDNYLPGTKFHLALTLAK